MGQTPTIASGAIAKLFVTVEALGLDAAAIAAEADFDRAVCADADARVPLRKLHALWAAIAARAGRPDVALVNAERFSPDDYGLVGFVALSSATLAEALGQLVRFMRLWTDSPVLELSESGRVDVRYRASFGDEVGLRYATEAALAEVLNGACLATGVRLQPLRVCLPHSAPADTRAHRAFFGVDVEFDAPAPLLQLSPEQLALPLARADAKLAGLLRGLAEKALAEQGDDESAVDAGHEGGAERSLSSAVRRAIAEALSRGMPSVGDIARGVGASERTLRRRLRGEGTTFRALLDATRADLARSYVAAAELPLCEVAYLLGFADPSAFNRAFKRWTGEAPSTYRRRR